MYICMDEYALFFFKSKWTSANWQMEYGNLQSAFGRGRRQSYTGKYSVNICTTVARVVKSSMTIGPSERFISRNAILMDISAA